MVALKISEALSHSLMKVKWLITKITIMNIYIPINLALKKFGNFRLINIKNPKNKTKINMAGHHSPSKNIANFLIKVPTGPKPKPIKPIKIKIKPVSSTEYVNLLASASLDFFFFAIPYHHRHYILCQSFLQRL